MKRMDFPICFFALMMCMLLIFSGLPLWAQMSTRSVPMPATGADEEAEPGGIASPTQEAYTAKIKEEDARPSSTFDGIGDPKAPKAKKDARIVKPNKIGTIYNFHQDKRIKYDKGNNDLIDYSEKKSSDIGEDIHISAQKIHTVDHDFHKISNETPQDIPVKN